MELSPFITFTADNWRVLRAATPLVFSEADLEKLRGLNVPLSMADIEGTYLPLSRLLSLCVGASQALYGAIDTFLGNLPAKVPFVIGIGGSVAVGKSTTARVLQSALARWPNHPKVDLVTTDGFLYPNAELERRGLMNRKGFPESYNRRDLLEFLSRVKAGEKNVEAPVYSHLRYDVIPDEVITIDQPDVLIVEGLTVLQTGVDGRDAVFVSDFFDFSIYVDAAEEDIREWYIERFLKLRQTAFANTASYFHKYSSLSDEEAANTAAHIWDTINGPNLIENILPTRSRAGLILTKGRDHSVSEVRLRRM